MNELEQMPTFSEIILFTDEAAFDRDGITNFHNTHEWMKANPPRNCSKKNTNNSSVVRFGEESLTIHLLDHISLKTD